MSPRTSSAVAREGRPRLAHAWNETTPVHAHVLLLQKSSIGALVTTKARVPTQQLAAAAARAAVAMAGVEEMVEAATVVVVEVAAVAVAVEAFV